MLLRLDSIILSKGIGSQFSAKSYSFSRFTPTFTQIFPVLLLFTPIFEVFMLRATLLTPLYALSILWVTCSNLVTELSLNGSDFGIQRSPKIGSLAKKQTFFWSPPLISCTLSYYRPNRLLFVKLEV